MMAVCYIGYSEEKTRQLGTLLLTRSKVLNEQCVWQLGY